MVFYFLICFPYCCSFSILFNDLAAAVLLVPAVRGYRVPDIRYLLYCPVAVHLRLILVLTIFFTTAVGSVFISFYVFLLSFYFSQSFSAFVDIYLYTAEVPIFLLWLGCCCVIRAALFAPGELKRSWRQTFEL